MSGCPGSRGKGCDCKANGTDPACPWQPDARSAAQGQEQALYEALLWISEYPNREHIYSEGDGVELAEYARETLNAYEASRV